MILKKMILTIKNKIRWAGDISPALFLVLVLGILAGCAYNYSPVSQNGIMTEEDYAIVKDSTGLSAISYKYWYRDPQNISDYYSTFWVSIQNNTKKKISIMPSDFILLDANRNQMETVPPEMVLKFVMRENDFSVSRFNVDNEQLLQETNKRIESERNVMTYSFGFGDLLPNASKNGYIFFPRLPSQNNVIYLIYKGKEITFQKKK